MAFTQNAVLEMTVFGRSTTGQQVLNIFHYRQETTTAQSYVLADLASAVTNFAVIWRTNVLPILSVNYKVEKYRGRSLTGTIANPTPPPPNILVVGDQFELVAPAGDVGTRAGEELVTFDAVGMQKLSDRAGRNFRGSARFGTLASIDVEGNALETTYKNLVVPNLGLFVAAILLVGDTFQVNWVMAIFSRTLVLAAPPPFGLLRDLTAGVVGARVNNFVTSQVSRKQSLTQTS